MKKISEMTDELAEEILKRYFRIEGKRVYADLYFDTFSELVDQNLGDDSVEKLNGVLTDKLSEIFALLPAKYEIYVNVRIRDFGNYTVEEAEKIVRRNIALRVYAFALERRRKRIAGLSMLVGGAALLLTSYLLGDFHKLQLLFDIINISGTLLVWEAANLTLIERSEEAKRAKQYVRKFKEIHLLRA